MMSLFMKNNSGISQEVHQKVVSLIKALIPQAKIYLFGSRARGDYHDRSDIDIALDAGEKLTRRTVGEARDVLEASNILYRIDIVDLNNIPAELKSVILKEAILWND
jgi:predicted nucleotidyltransferase